MSFIRYVTLTGVDESSSLAKLLELSIKYPIVEWGVLYHPELAGNSPRYPKLEWIEEFVNQAKTQNLNISLHICGPAVKHLLNFYNKNRTDTVDTFLVERLLKLIDKFGRVQLNTKAESQDVFAFMNFIEVVHSNAKRTRVIMQRNEHNKLMCKALKSQPGFEVLVDDSFGTGKLRTEWPQPTCEEIQSIGYAGGLGPFNLESQLPLIDIASNGRTYWIDMETGIRTPDNQFDLSACEKVLVLTDSFIKAKLGQQCALHGTGFRSLYDLPNVWLNWWVAHSLKLPVTIPTLNSSEVFVLNRPTGLLKPYKPHLDRALCSFICEQEKIALHPRYNNTWEAHSLSKLFNKISHPSMLVAGLQAVVYKHHGDTLPVNPFESSC